MVLYTEYTSGKLVIKSADGHFRVTSQEILNVATIYDLDHAKLWRITRENSEDRKQMLIRRSALLACICSQSKILDWRKG